MTKATATPEKPPSWSGLILVLVVGLGLIGLIVWGISQIKQQSVATEQRIREEWLDPYALTLRESEAERAWQTLVTDEFRKRHPRVDFVQRTGSVIEALGRPISTEIISVHGAGNVLEGRAYQRVVTRWRWERGADFNRTFELVDDASAGFQMDGSSMGGRGGKLPPADIPGDGW